MANDRSNIKSQIPSVRHSEIFPLALCIACICATSFGLTAAACGVKWGAAPAPGDVLREAWLYVQVMATLMWLVAWPAMTRAGKWGALGEEFAVIVMGALPAATVAAVLTSAPAAAVMTCILWQGSCGIFAFGTLALGTRWRAVPMILPASALALPVAAYLLSDFFELAPWSALWRH